MPYYDYVCEECTLEMIDTKQKITDPKLTKCPACGKESLKRKIGASSFHLKGSGWCDSILDNAKK
jgi:putative FmdB family regulatory protein